MEKSRKIKNVSNFPIGCFIMRRGFSVTAECLCVFVLIMFIRGYSVLAGGGAGGRCRSREGKGVYN